MAEISPVLLNQIAAAKVAQNKTAMQEPSDESIWDISANYDGPNLMVRNRQSEDLEKLKSTQTPKAEKSSKAEETKVLESEEIEQLANMFQKGNEELNPRILVILRNRLSPDDSQDDILEKVNATYADPALADEALDFLSQTATPQTKQAIDLAKEQLNATYGREIKAGRNMGTQAREFSKEGLGSPTSLRDLYREMTRIQRDPLKLFSDLTEKFRFEKMKSVITFLLHSLGSDLKAKGPSILPGELKKLIDDTRSLQGILGIFRFFQSRMQIITNQFGLHQLVFPEKINFEVLSRLLVKLLQERYINPDKIRQTAQLLGISEELLAQIIVYNQMREALRQIAPRYYRNQQHKDELTKSFIDLIEKLEDEEEEESEEEEKDK